MIIRKKGVPLLVLTLACIFAGCSKKDTVQPSSLEITVQDGVSAVSGATVKLYLSQQDLLNQSNQADITGITNSSGVVTFSGLNAVKYYFLVESGCKNNLNGTVTSANPLSANVKNTATVNITGTGTLKMINNSTNPYDVYANGILVIHNMAGGTTQNLTGAPTGNWTIRVLQQSGYVFTPTDKTFMGVLTCGSTLTTTFP